LRVDCGELAADALDVRRDRAVVDDDVRIAHQAVAVLHVARILGERMDHPELGQRQVDAPAVPLRHEALRVERQRPA
jgi:hypothetical protein